MTRVNLVAPEELADQHLFAEFRELKMVPKSLARSLRALHKGGDAIPGIWARERRMIKLLAKIPEAYCLGAGHVSFFYDKGAFLQDRYDRLRHELRHRGVQFNETALLDPDHVFDFDKRLAGLYDPPPEAIALNRARIAERIAQKPGWYRWTNRSPLLA